MKASARNITAATIALMLISSVQAASPANQAAKPGSTVPQKQIASTQASKDAGGTPALPGSKPADSVKPSWQFELDKVDEILKTMGTFETKSGGFDDAKQRRIYESIEAHLQNALKIARDGGTATQQAEILYRIGDNRFFGSNYGDSAAAFEESLSLRKKDNPADTVEVGKCLEQIGLAKSMMTNWEDDERSEKETAIVVDYMQQAYDIYMRLLPADDPQLALPVDYMADYASSPEEGIVFQKQKLSIEDKQYGKSNPDLVATQKFMVAIAMGDAGQLDNAISTGQEAYADYKKASGNDTYLEYIQETITHWKNQKLGLEEAWDVLYTGKYAGRNSRQKTENFSPPTVKRLEEEKPEVRQKPKPPPDIEPDPEPEVPKASPPEPEKGKRYYAEDKECTRAEYEALRLSNQACDLIEEHKYADAKKLLLTAVAYDPDLSSARANLGLVLSKLGESKDAIAHLKAAVKLAPDESAPLAMLASVYQGSGRLDDAIKTYRMYMDRYSGESDLHVVKALIDDLKKIRERQQAVEARLPEGPPKEHYLPYATDKGLSKWTSGKIPIKIYISAGNGVGGFRDSYKRILQECFDGWLAGSGGLISFQPVSNKKEAQIACVFTNDFSQVSSPAEGGEAQMWFDPDKGEFKNCVIYLLTRQPMSTLTPTDNDMRAVSLHEIGHTLGLMGHSPDPQDIMYCTLPDTELKRPDLTERDINTLKRLYGK